MSIEGAWKSEVVSDIVTVTGPRDKSAAPTTSPPPTTRACPRGWRGETGRVISLHIFLGLTVIMGVAVAFETDLEKNPILFVSGPIKPKNSSPRDPVAERQPRESILVQADSPFSVEDAKSGNEYFSSRPLHVRKKPSLTKGKQKSDEEIRKEYDIKGARFIQIFSVKECTYLAVYSNNRSVSTVDDERINATFFQLTYVEGKNISGYTIENVHSCLFLCLKEEGQFYTTKKPDKECLFHRTTDNESSNKEDVNAYKSLISSKFSNKTHNLLLSVDRPAPSTPRGKMVRIRHEKPSNAFNMPDVSFETLQSVFDMATIRRFYKYSVRHRDFCPEEKSENHTQVKVSSQAGSQDKRKPICSKIKNRKEREKCRERKIEKCIRRRKHHGKDPLEQPCTAEERKRRKKIKYAWPWQNESQSCSTMKSRSDRRLCKREQRRKCRADLRKNNPQMSTRKVKISCKRKQWLQDCMEKQKRKHSRLKQHVSHPEMSNSCKNLYQKRSERRRKKEN